MRPAGGVAAAVGIAGTVAIVMMEQKVQSGPKRAEDAPARQRGPATDNELTQTETNRQRPAFRSAAICSWCCARVCVVCLQSFPAAHMYITEVGCQLSL
jgi:hypothetical protein